MDVSPEYFIRYVIEENKKHEKFQNINEHWRPQTSNCPFCDLNFTVIGHYETIHEDTAYILLKSNLTKLLKVGGANRDSNHSNKNERRKAFWSQVDTRHLDDLLQIFHTDFQFFEFDRT